MSNYLTQLLSENPTVDIFDVQTKPPKEDAPKEDASKGKVVDYSDAPKEWDMSNFGQGPSMARVVLISMAVLGGVAAYKLWKK